MVCYSTKMNSYLIRNNINKFQQCKYIMVFNDYILECFIFISST